MFLIRIGLGTLTAGFSFRDVSASRGELISLFLHNIRRLAKRISARVLHDSIKVLETESSTVVVLTQLLIEKIYPPRVVNRDALVRVTREDATPKLQVDL